MTAPDPLDELLTIAAALNADPLRARTTWEADAQTMARLVARLVADGRLPWIEPGPPRSDALRVALEGHIALLRADAEVLRAAGYGRYAGRPERDLHALLRRDPDWELAAVLDLRADELAPLLALGAGPDEWTRRPGP